MKSGGTFDIHLATDVVSPAIESRLAEMGFVKDSFISGIEGVIRPNHFSKHPTNKDQFVNTWSDIKALLSVSSPSEYHGYAEAEVVSVNHCTLISLAPFNDKVPFPFARFDQTVCPVGRCKEFDIHISADLASLSPQLKHILESEINFYYVDVRKSAGNIVRVYTFQTLGVVGVPNLYDLLVSYLQSAGGMQGKVKLEATYGYERFPATSPVPPVVLGVTRTSPA